MFEHIFHITIFFLLLCYYITFRDIIDGLHFWFKNFMWNKVVQYFTRWNMFQSSKNMTITSVLAITPLFSYVIWNIFTVYFAALHLCILEVSSRSGSQNIDSVMSYTICTLVRPSACAIICFSSSFYFIIMNSVPLLQLSVGFSNICACIRENSSFLILLWLCFTVVVNLWCWPLQNQNVISPSLWSYLELQIKLLPHMWCSSHCISPVHLCVNEKSIPAPLYLLSLLQLFCHTKHFEPNSHNLLQTYIYFSNNYCPCWVTIILLYLLWWAICRLLYLLPSFLLVSYIPQEPKHLDRQPHCY